MWYVDQFSTSAASSLLLGVYYLDVLNLKRGSEVMSVDAGSECRISRFLNALSRVGQH